MTVTPLESFFVSSRPNMMSFTASLSNRFGAWQNRVRRYCARTQRSPHMVHDVVDLGHIDIALAECLPLVGQVDVVLVCVIDDKERPRSSTRCIRGRIALTNLYRSDFTFTIQPSAKYSTTPSRGLALASPIAWATSSGEWQIATVSGRTKPPARVNVSS